MNTGEDGMSTPLIKLTIVLNADQQTAFNDYLRSGGNYMGIHSAADCLQTTAFYNATVGAIFDYHPPIQDAVSIT